MANNPATLEGAKEKSAVLASLLNVAAILVGAEGLLAAAISRPSQSATQGNADEIPIPLSDESVFLLPDLFVLLQTANDILSNSLLTNAVSPQINLDTTENFAQLDSVSLANRRSRFEKDSNEDDQDDERDWIFTNAYSPFSELINVPIKNDIKLNSEPNTTTETSSMITGTDNDETLQGDNNNNTLDGKGGADNLKGKGGDDTLIYDSADTKIDGGSGYDTLQLNGSNQYVDFSQYSGKGNDKSPISGIEKIDITSTGNNTLILTLHDILNLPDTVGTVFSEKALTIEGNMGDSVTVADGEWGYQGISNNYHIYTSTAATLLVNTEIDNITIQVTASVL